MSRYWTRIGLGALLVFCLGMAGLAAARRGTAEVKNFLTSVATRLPLRLAHVGFRFEGRQVGELTGLDVVRKQREEVGRVTGRVELSELGALASLRDCALTVDRLDRWSDRTTFFCAPQNELESGRLVEVGEMIFQPGGLSRPLYLPAEVVSDWRRSGIERLEASLARDDHGGVRALGSFGLRDSKRGTQNGSFDLRADSGGAMFSVRDEFNRPIVDFQAGHEGLHLSISDRHGRNLLRLLADSLGAALKIK